ncbi:MAG: molybdopterin-dependent oxidoreductase [Proteobacteria bacterium]|nr:molybdopterin-dependent oxidoreductase [Pseudomonadota bacterium]
MNASPPFPADSEVRIVRTTSAFNCGGRCPLRLHVRDNVIIRIEGDDAAEPDQLRTCLRCRAYRKHVHHPDRLLQPQKRVGPRGEGRFEPISWEEALEIAAGELERVKETYGSASILLAVSGGYLGSLHEGARATGRLLSLFGGYTTHYGNVSSEGPIWAATTQLGTPLTGHSRDDLLNARLILLWGYDPARVITGTNTMYELVRAREAGARIVSIDPRYHDSAAVLAHEWLPVHPGTDTAVMAAMAWVMIEEGLCDFEFLDRYTIGFDRFRDYVLGLEDKTAKTPRWAAELSGAPADRITALARAYATIKPAALMDAHGPARSAMGEQFSRMAITLAAMTGNIGRSGGGVGGAFMNLPFGHMYAAPMIPGVRNPVEAGGPSLRGSLDLNLRLQKRIHTNRIFDAILEGTRGGYPADIRLAWFLGNNFLNQLGNTNKAARALKQLEFMIVSELFLTPTARFADLIFPVTSAAERNDLTRGWPSGLYYTAVNRAIEPLGACRSDLEIAMALAAKLGLEEFGTFDEEDWLRTFVEKNPETATPIPDSGAFRRKGIHRLQPAGPHVAFKAQIEDPDRNPFPTPSGKIEIYSERVAAMNDPACPPIPKYLPTPEDRLDPASKSYPLQLVSPHPSNRVHSDMQKIDWLVEADPHRIWINPADARTRGIAEGDAVLAFNDRGRLSIPARVTERIMPGVVCIFEGAWFDPDENGLDRGGNPNVLTPDTYTRGGASIFNTTRVQVQKA